jgi:hypothetical protein
MRNLTAIALGLLIMGLGLYSAAAVTPLAFPSAFSAQAHTSNPAALTVMLAITLVSTTFAGWICARLAPDHRLGHALMMGVLGLAAAVCAGAIRWAAAPAWYYFLSWGLIPVAAALGAAAWQRSLRRRSTALSRRAAAT